MRWPWSKRKAPLPIPPYVPPIEREHAPPVETGLQVDEVDTTDFTKTGVHREWKRLAAKP